MLYPSESLFPSSQMFPQGGPRLTVRMPDVEQLLVDAGNNAFSEVPFSTGTFDRESFVRVLRTGGPSRSRITADPTVSFEAYAGTESEAAVLAEDVRAWVCDLPGAASLDGFWVKSVTEVGGIVNLPDPRSRLARYTFTVELRIRGKATP